MTYALFKLLHVAGAVLFLGNLLVAAWWKLAADRTGSPATVAFALRQVQRTDLWLTGGGALLLAAGGVGMLAANGGAGLESAWLSGGIGLFVVSGALWAVVLIPLQGQMRRALRGVAAAAPLPERYRQLSRWWALAGGVATLLPLLALALMVVKPGA